MQFEWGVIAQHISQTTGQPFSITEQRPVGGGSINQAYCISNEQHRYFAKLNQASQVTMFEVEALGLKTIQETQTICVPQPLCWGIAGQYAYLVTYWLEFGYGNDQTWEKMGHNLAAMHRSVSSQGFGWQRDNVIGSTPQKNTWTEDWPTFFRDYRLRYQFQLAQRRGGHFPRQEALLAAIPDLLAGYDPAPALVHGDLWSGNASVTRSGEPVILDPAVYYGDREVDIAMTELFGGFSPAFYRGYDAAYPLDSGYRNRKDLYNLYHILNHFNLFGGGYGSQANRIIDQLLA